MTSSDAPISAENKLIARYVAAAFGGTPRVIEYANESKSLTVGVLSCCDRPNKGVTSYSTIKLSDHPMKWGDGEFPTRLELAGVCVSTAEFFPNMLASAAFSIMQSEAARSCRMVSADTILRRVSRTFILQPPSFGSAS
jgi:antitoxin YqcF